MDWQVVTCVYLNNPGAARVGAVVDYWHKQSCGGDPLKNTGYSQPFQLVMYNLFSSNIGLFFANKINYFATLKLFFNY